MKASAIILFLISTLQAETPPPPAALWATWNVNPEPIVEGYIFWGGPTSRFDGGVYPWAVKVVGRFNTNATMPLSTLHPGVNYFAVQAYARAGALASPYSDEAMWTNGLSAPTGLWLKPAP